MNAKLILLCAVALAASPLAFAHAPAGTPKNYCEPAAEWVVHDYGPVASGRLLYTNQDGNIGGDCDPGFDLGYVCAGVDPEDPVNTFLVGICDFNPPIADFDGHSEFAYGGAWLLVEPGTGEPSPDPSQGAGTLFCFGEEGHHTQFGPVTVEDVVLDTTPTADGFQYANFLVAADLSDLTGTGQGCGDFQSDHSQGCRRSCSLITFSSGLDGSYQVYVVGTQGHVRTDIGHGCEEDGLHVEFNTNSLEEHHVGCYAIRITNHADASGDLVVQIPGTPPNCDGGPLPIPPGETRVCYWGRGTQVLFSTTDPAHYSWEQI